VISFESHNNNGIVLNDYMNGDIFKLESHVTFNFRFLFKLRTFEIEHVLLHQMIILQNTSK
jgi:hypothetical protein